MNYVLRTLLRMLREYRKSILSNNQLFVSISTLRLFRFPTFRDESKKGAQTKRINKLWILVIDKIFRFERRLLSKDDCSGTKVTKIDEMKIGHKDFKPSKGVSKLVKYKKL